MSSQNALNLLELYSLPLSDLSTLSLYPLSISTILLNFLKRMVCSLGHINQYGPILIGLYFDSPYLIVFTRKLRYSKVVIISSSHICTYKCLALTLNKLSFLCEKMKLLLTVQQVIFIYKIQREEQLSKLLNQDSSIPSNIIHTLKTKQVTVLYITCFEDAANCYNENETSQHEAIQKFIEGTVVDGAPVVPISAQLKYNIDVVCEYIVKKIPIPERNFTSPPNMIVIRSFDVTKPGFEVDDIKGGVAGGSILRVNQFIDDRPGIVVKDENGNIKCTPIYYRIVSLHAEQNEIQFAVPGGLIGVGTTMDPTLTRADRLVGQVLEEVGSLPEVFVELEVNFFLLRHLLGVRTKGSDRQGKVSKLARGGILMLNIGSMSTGARVLAVKNDLAKLQLTSPVCTSKGEKIALSR
ncbi:hypothetical protein ACOSP7_014512 [Xanthoceras sorbifolium]